MTAAVNIRAERRNRGWTLGDAARRFNISVAALSMIERGERVPGPRTAFAIASEYGYRVTDIWPEPDHLEAA